MSQGKKTKVMSTMGLRCVREMFRLEPIKVTSYVFLNIIYSLAWVLQVQVLQRYFECISNVTGGWKEIVFTLVGVGLSYAFYHLMDGVNNCYPETITLCINKKLNLRIYKEISTLNPIEFEDSERLEQINKVLNGSQSLVRVGSVLIDIVSYYATYFIFMGSYLFLLDSLLAISILMVFIPVIITKMADIWIFKNLEDDLASERRKMEAYEKCIGDKEYYKETRLLGAHSFFVQLYLESLNKHSESVLKAQLKKNSINFCLNIVTALSYGGIILLFFSRVMKGIISVGAFVAILTSINSLFRFMNKMVIDRFGWAAQNIGSVWNYFSFIDEPKTAKAKRCSKKGLITLENVGFMYPDSTTKVLEGISFSIAENEKIAIVGENGSGKTTLCRILLGLYNPTEGNVFYNNQLLEETRCCGMSAVFQKYNRYKMTLKENLIISHPDKEMDDMEIEELCKECGISIDDSCLPEGIATQLGNEFGGTDISGGQWQRVAIARGIYRKGKIIILDEPTAAIDPLEETRIYKEFERIAEGSAMVTVTHRLGSVQFADKIIVLKHGRVVQFGNHEELINVDGEYKKLYLSQKKWYT